MNRRETQRIISPPGRARSKIIAFVLAIASFSLVVVLPNHAEEKINIKVNYVAKLNELAKASRPEELNAAPFYNKAFELAIEQPKKLKKLDYKAWPDDLTAEQRKALQTWVRQSSKALTQLKKGTQKPYYWFKYQGTSLWDAKVPALNEARSLAFSICWRAKLNIAKTDLETAFADLLLCYRFGMHFTGPKSVVEQYVGVNVRALAVNAAFQILDKEKPPSDLLKDFQQQLQVFFAEQDHVIDFTFEKFVLYDVIQRVFTDDGQGSGHVYGTRPLENPSDLLKLLLEISDVTEEQTHTWEKLERRETTNLTNKVFEYFGRAVQKTPYELYKEGKNPEKAVEEMTKTNPMLNTLTPPFDRFLQMSYREKIGTGALITTISILRYKADKGLLPENLKQLVSAGYLKNLPMDPYSDKSLIYKQTKDNFTLYSFGADLDDDGGAPSKWGEGEKGGDQVFWPVQSPEKQKNKANGK